MNTPNTKSMSKSQLASAYGVHPSTLMGWLKRVPNLNLAQGQRILTPKQVALIMAHLGEP